MQLRDLGGYFRLESKPILFDRDPGEQLPLESLVSRFHVREIQVGEHVRKERQQLVSKRMPEEEHAMRPRQESRTIDDIGQSR